MISNNNLTGLNVDGNTYVSNTLTSNTVSANNFYSNNVDTPQIYVNNKVLLTSSTLNIGSDIPLAVNNKIANATSYVYTTGSRNYIDVAPTKRNTITIANSVIVSNGSFTNTRSVTFSSIPNNYRDIIIELENVYMYTGEAYMNQVFVFGYVGNTNFQIFQMSGATNGQYYNGHIIIRGYSSLKNSDCVTLIKRSSSPFTANSNPYYGNDNNPNQCVVISTPMTSIGVQFGLSGSTSIYDVAGTVRLKVK